MLSFEEIQFSPVSSGDIVFCHFLLSRLRHCAAIPNFLNTMYPFPRCLTANKIHLRISDSSLSTPAKL